MEDKYNKIKEGDSFEIKRKISIKNINSFIKLTGDINPIHTNEENSRKAGFKGIMAHGLHASSFFPTVFRKLCHDEDSICLTFNLNFEKPIYSNEELRIKGTIKKKVECLRVLIIKIEMFDKDDNLLITGEAMIKVV